MNVALAPRTFSAVLTVDREELRTWLRAVLQHKGWAGIDLARAIEAHPSTINKFLNDPAATHTLSPKSLKAIERATGFPPLTFPGGPARRPTEPEAVSFGEENTGDEALDRIVVELTRGENAIDPWILKGRALEAAGFMEGDVLLVNLSEKPRVNDVVCAQIHDWQRGRAETVFRIYQPPYLIAATSSAELMRPFLVDDDRVVIMGVVMQSLRQRRSVGAAA